MKLKKENKIKNKVFVIAFVLFATMTIYQVTGIQKGPVAPAFAMDLASGITCTDKGYCSPDPFGSGASECDCFENSYGAIYTAHHK